MECKIGKKKSDFSSTGFMGIGPGSHMEKHSQEGFLFIWEDAFGVFEGIAMRYFKGRVESDSTNIQSLFPFENVHSWIYKVSSSVGFLFAAVSSCHTYKLLYSEKTNFSIVEG